jgi:hypothetical protein
MAEKITVKAKQDAGWHPVHGTITKGQEYTMEEHEFSDELFVRPRGFIPPWERPAPAETAPAETAPAPAAPAVEETKKTGGDQ